MYIDPSEWSELLGKFPGVGEVDVSRPAKVTSVIVCFSDMLRAWESLTPLERQAKDGAVDVNVRKINDLIGLASANAGFCFRVRLSVSESSHRKLVFHVVEGSDKDMRGPAESFRHHTMSVEPGFGCFEVTFNGVTATEDNRIVQDTLRLLNSSMAIQPK